MLKTILIIIGSIAGLIVLLIIFIRIAARQTDKGAEKAARKFCEDNGLGFKKVKAFPNHFGLYYLQNGKTHYAGFHYEVKGDKMIWLNSPPA